MEVYSAKYMLLLASNHYAIAVCEMTAYISLVFFVRLLRRANLLLLDLMLTKLFWLLWLVLLLRMGIMKPCALALSELFAAWPILAWFFAEGFARRLLLFLSLKALESLLRESLG